MLNCKLSPDLIFGWELEEDKIKPNSYPIIETMKQYDLESSEILVVDDLKPGLDMARSCSVDFAAAGWSHIITEIKDYMKLNSDYYFSSVKNLKDLIFS